MQDGGGGRTNFRVKLLGEFERFTPDGSVIEAPATNRPRPEDARVLAMLVLHRIGQPVPEKDLLRMGWDNDTGGREDLQPAISRLRGPAKVYGPAGQIPIAMNRVNKTYTLDLSPAAVDATYFIERVNAGLSNRAGDLDHLCALWRGNPFRIYGNIPDAVWKPLTIALERFKRHLRALARPVTLVMPHWEPFWSVWGEVVQPRPRVLIVDDDASFVDSLRKLLTGHPCECAHDIQGALGAIATHVDWPFGAAIVDLHLTEEGGDFHGLTVLDEIVRKMPDIPRVLLTRSSLAGSQIEVVQRYGLSDVLLKGDPGQAAVAAAHVRSHVEEMLNDTGKAVRAAAEAEIAKLDRAIGRALARAQVAGDTRQAETIGDLHRRYCAAAEHLEVALEREDAGRAEVRRFVEEWTRRVDGNIGPTSRP